MSNAEKIERLLNALYGQEDRESTRVVARVSSVILHPVTSVAAWRYILGIPVVKVAMSGTEKSNARWMFDAVCPWRFRALCFPISSNRARSMPTGGDRHDRIFEHEPTKPNLRDSKLEPWSRRRSSTSFQKYSGPGGKFTGSKTICVKNESAQSWVDRWMTRSAWECLTTATRRWPLASALKRETLSTRY